MPKIDSKKILQSVQAVLQENSENTITVQEILDKCGIPLNQYIEALKDTHTSVQVIHKRQPKDVYTNNYNQTIMKAWQANMDLQYVTDAYACIMYIVSYITKDERQLSDLLRNASKQANDTDLRKQLRQLGNIFLNHREISAQEAIYRVLPLPLRRTSRSIVFVPTDMPEDRVRLAKPSYLIDQLDDDSSDIFANSILDKYMARPDTLNTLCLAEFASWYTTYSKPQEDDSHPQIFEEANSSSSKIKLKDGKGYMSRRKSQAIIRTHRHSKLKQPEKYSYSKLMLYIPWRTETELKRHFTTYHDAYLHFSSSILENSSKFEQNTVEIESALEQYEEIGPVTGVWDIVNAQAVQRNEDDMNVPNLIDSDSAFLNPEFHDVQNISDHIRADIGISAMEFTLKHHLLDDIEYRSLICSLNKEQRLLFDEILHWCRKTAQSRKLGSKPQPFHIFVTGGVGTGKSVLIKALYNMAVQELRYEGDNPDDTTILLMVPTGTAGYNIHGTTIHTALKLPIKQHSSQSEYIPLSPEKLHELRCLVSNLTVAIVDEVSMVGSEDHRQLSEIKGTSSADVYFGGVSIVVVGDLYQPPPVGQQPVYALPKSPLARIADSLWENLFHVYHLDTIMRQQDDLEFANLLNRVRLQKHTEGDIKILQSRVIERSDQEYPTDALHIFPTNKEVDSYNSEKLATLNQPIITLKAKDTKPDNSISSDTCTLPDNPALTGGLRTELQLCIGARVMVTKNIDINDGIVNGTQGTVVGFWSSGTPSEIIAVIIKCDNEHCGTQTRLKYKQIARNFSNAVPIFRDEVSICIGKHSKQQINRIQFPLRLSWACTVHKTQGMTLTHAVFSMKGRFSDGQCYVALSRVTSLSGLHLTNFDPQKIRASSKTAEAMTAINKRPVHLTMNPVIQRPSNLLTIAVINIRSINQSLGKFATHAGNEFSRCHSSHRNVLKDGNKTPDLWNMKFYRQDRTSRRAGGILTYLDKQYISTLISKETSPQIDIICAKMTLPVCMRSVVVITIYCAVDGNSSSIQEVLEKYISAVSKDDQIIIVGDFNTFVRSKNLKSLLSRYHLVQLFPESMPTHTSGTAIDQAFSNMTETLQVHCTTPYYSDHNILWIGIPI